MLLRVLLLASIAGLAAAQVPAADSTWLVATTQSLLDAVYFRRHVALGLSSRPELVQKPPRKGD
jgi:hypothetical protein